MSRPLIFCAVDTNNLDRAVALSREVGPVTKGLKLGLEFVSAFGPQGIEKIREVCPSAALFIDLKFHDIPNTAAGAVRAMAERFAPEFLNVHAAGGLEMMRAAKEACGKKTGLLGVTILTSLDDQALQQTGYQGNTASCVQTLAGLTQKAGLDGVVCAPQEIALLRKSFGPDFVLMVPGIRPAGADRGDQKRVMTPLQAVQAGASHLVIGRPITESADPAAAAQALLDGINV